MKFFPDVKPGTESISKQSDLSKLSRQELLELIELTGQFAQETEDKFYIYSPNSDVIAKFHSSDSYVKSLISGNRGGKTAALCIEAVIAATGEIPPKLEKMYPKQFLKVPCFVRLNAVDYDNGVAKILKPEFKKWLPQKYFDGETVDPPTIYLNNGSVIEFMSYDQKVSKHGGTSRHFVGFDELPPPDIIKENQMRVADSGGRMIFSFSPIMLRQDLKTGKTTSNAEAISFFYQNFYKKAGRVVRPTSDVLNKDGFSWIEMFHINVQDNKHINQEAYEKITSSLSALDREARVKGEFTHLIGLVYGEEYDENVHVLTDFELKKNWPTYCAVDPHPSTPHHVTYLTIGPYNKYYVSDELVVTGLAEDLYNAMLVKEKENGFWIKQRVIDPIADIPDPVTGRSFAQELRSKGMAFVPGSKEKWAGILKVKEAFKNNNLFIFSDCMGHRWEISNYIWKGDKAVDDDDHFMENLRRIVILQPRFIEKDEFESYQKRRPKWQMY